MNIFNIKSKGKSVGGMKIYNYPLEIFFNGFIISGVPCLLVSVKIFFTSEWEGFEPSVQR